MSAHEYDGGGDPALKLPPSLKEPESDEASTGVAQRILEMRRTFDGAFAAPRRAAVAEDEKIVILDVGSSKLACRVGQIARLEADRKIVPLAGGARGLLGLAGIRGKLVPVYGLALLLGTGAAGATRWLALCGGADPIALAFDRLDRFVRAHRTDLCALNDAGGGPSHVTELLRLGGEVYNVLDIDSVLAAIRAQGIGDAHTV
jgi:purine-binding chemotaxis protein CheW